MKSMLYVLIVLGMFSPVFAEKAANPPQEESIFMAGVGTLFVDKAQKGADTDLYVLPLLIDTKHHLMVYGTNIQYVLYYDDGWMFSAIGASRLEGYDHDESPRLAGMKDRDNTYELGASLSREFSWGKIEGLFLTDILDEHRGQEARLTCSKKFSDVLDIKSLKLTPSIGFNWRSHQLNDYYYGVKTVEAAVGRPAYHAGSSNNLLTGLRADYSLNERWNVFGSLNIEWLGSEITDSPVVDNDHLLSVFLGVLGRF